MLPARRPRVMLRNWRGLCAYDPYGATRSGTVGTDYLNRKVYSKEDAVWAKPKLPNNGRMPIVDYRARYYDPRLQWIQPDTIVPDFANPQSLNRHTLNIKQASPG
jgi:hypothetical protein